MAISIFFMLLAHITLRTHVEILTRERNELQRKQDDAKRKIQELERQIQAMRDELVTNQGMSSSSKKLSSVAPISEGGTTHHDDILQHHTMSSSNTEAMYEKQGSRKDTPIDNRTIRARLHTPPEAPSINKKRIAQLTKLQHTLKNALRQVSQTRDDLTTLIDAKDDLEQRTINIEKQQKETASQLELCKAKLSAKNEELQHATRMNHQNQESLGLKEREVKKLKRTLGHLLD
ncbi:hypothetical protein O0I10_004623 [Lichtheimia ornata]|uniref:Uncharacterized protein n=1 Tax=Lichtheimia ornata TaxID=688661 RepID=A0AAD7XWG2_9FUNG|nr:uncharacterized protein O0I10_004623 [Lichtheimia ornata]KAJ8659644.1 hypothetical protein O0I10_004623 [Lichtheimia ornata]